MGWGSNASTMQLYMYFRGNERYNIYFEKVIIKQQSLITI